VGDSSKYTSMLCVGSTKHRAVDGSIWYLPAQGTDRVCSNNSQGRRPPFQRLLTCLASLHLSHRHTPSQLLLGERESNSTLLSNTKLLADEAPLPSRRRRLNETTQPSSKLGRAPFLPRPRRWAPEGQCFRRKRFVANRERADRQP
jgi:hypothetical protein